MYSKKFSLTWTKQQIMHNVVHTLEQLYLQDQF